MWFGLSLACVGDLLGCWLIAGKSILSDIGSLPVIRRLLFRSQQPKSDNLFNAINSLILAAPSSRPIRMATGVGPNDTPSNYLSPLTWLGVDLAKQGVVTFGITNSCPIAA